MTKNYHFLGSDKVNNEKGGLVTGSLNILVRWRNHFYQLLNAHGYNNVRHTGMFTAEPVVPDPNAFEFEISVEKTKRHKSPGTDQISTELFKAGGRTMILDP
jgi:hypothetical protein